MAAKKKTSSKKVKKTANKTNKIKIDDYNEYYSNIISPGFLSDLHAAVCDALNLNIVSSYQINKTLPKKVSTSKNTKSLKKEDISQYIEMFNETLNNCKEKISYAKNSSNDSNLIEKCNILENKIQEQLKNAEVNLSRDIKNTLNNLNDIVAETNKLYLEASNIKEKMDSIYQKCKDKLKEIKELSQDFEYAIKNDYYKNCDDVEIRLNNCVDNKDELNKIIDEINNLYRNAYNRKHNKSSLSYVMDIEEEDIDLLEHI